MDGDTIIDPCKFSAYEAQMQRVEALSKPKPDRSIRAADLELLGMLKKNVAEFKTKCSSHTRMLARPKMPLPKIHFVNKAEREAQREAMEEMPKKELRWLKWKAIPPYVPLVKRSALMAKSTPRLDNIAMAKLKPLVMNKRMYYDKLPKKQKEAIVRHIKENVDDFKSRYPPESEKMYEIINGVIVHAHCVHVREPTDKDKKMYLCELNKNQRKAFRKRMKAMSLPRVHETLQTAPDRGQKKSLKDFEPWLSMIAAPRMVKRKDSFDPFKVKETALTYEPTERILEMARRRATIPPPPLYDFQGRELPPKKEWTPESRRRIVASARTIELAVPKHVKKKAADDEKEDPFAVPRRALTAQCSPRVAELAVPKSKK